ncbi:MAG: hypothetical protein PHD48_03235 [Alphaproteobacteria bacterium]|nr:hypothetical protein [Alphaproteobacteria bacterium]
MKKQILTALSVMCLWASGAQAMEITGFRSAEFGQKEAQVAEAAQKDLKVSAAQVKKNIDKTAGVTVLSVDLKSFEPLSLPAEVSYVLGSKCNCLTQVIVSWRFPERTTMETRGVAMQGIAGLAGHFSQGSWGKNETITNRVMSQAKEGEDNTIIFFRGQNPSGSAVTLLASPVKMMKPKDAKKGSKDANEALAANIDGIAVVSLSYEKDSKNPDIKKMDLSGF